MMFRFLGPSVGLLGSRHGLGGGPIGGQHDQPVFVLEFGDPACDRPIIVLRVVFDRVGDSAKHQIFDDDDRIGQMGMNRACRLRRRLRGLTDRRNIGDFQHALALFSRPAQERVLINGDLSGDAILDEFG